MVGVYWLRPIRAGKSLSLGPNWRRWLRLSPKREENAQVEDPYGREKALQQDWHRQNQAGPDEDASHPYVEATQSEAQAGTDPAGFRWRLQKGSAHDSLRLSHLRWGGPLDWIRAAADDGPLKYGPRRMRNAFAPARDSGLNERVKRLKPRLGLLPPAAMTNERKMENTDAPRKT